MDPVDVYMDPVDVCRALWHPVDVCRALWHPVLWHRRGVGQGGVLPHSSAVSEYALVP